MSTQRQRNVISAQKPRYVLLPAAEGLLKAFAAWYTKSSEIFVEYATSLAQRQSPETISLLAHIAWYFDSTFGLPNGILDPNLETHSYVDLFRFLDEFRTTQSIPMAMMNYLWDIMEIPYLARFEEELSLKRKNEEKQSLKRKIEAIILLVQKSFETEWKLLESSTAAEDLHSCGYNLG